MALTRRSGARFEATIWPGFVDAMTALLLILMFVLSIFMIVQFSLRETLTGQTEKIRTQDKTISSQGQEIDRLSAQLSDLADVLALERTGRQEAEAEAGELRASLSAEQSESERLNAALAAMAAARERAEGRVAELSTELTQTVSARDALRSELAAARTEIDAREEAARLAAAQREAMEALIADLRTETAEKGQQIASLSDERARALALVAALEEKSGDQAAAIARLEDAQAEALKRLSQTETKLTAEEEARALEAAAAEALRQRLAASQTELDAATLALEEARRDAEETLTLLAAAEAAKEKLQSQVTVQDNALTDAEALQRIAQAQLAEANERTAEEARKTALLNQQVRALREQLGSLQSLLDEAENRDEAQKVQIAELGQKLNAALAQKVSELSRYRSEFFGKMREALAGREDIRMVGDRFVFQSEVLFAPGSAELDPAGVTELSKLGQVIREVSKTIPSELDWIVRVDGHTDQTPVRGGGPFANWELSQSRALSVVRYLVTKEGVPPERLAAAGFGEYQPLVPGDTPEDRARNRRIEFKFTER